MSHFHAVVWIDHDEAHVIHFNRDQADELTVHAKHRRERLHHKRGQVGAGRAPEDAAFFDLVGKALAGAGEVLIVGPANAKEELARHFKEHDKTLSARVVGVESVDHPSDGQLLKLARKYFDAADRMRPAM